MGKKCRLLLNTSFVVGVALVDFFSGRLNPEQDGYAQGEQWYRQHFPLLKNMQAEQCCFEATPLYLFNPLAAQRMFKLLPKVKLIILLRNPTERAISQYFHEMRLDWETCSKALSTNGQGFSEKAGEGFEKKKRKGHSMISRLWRL